MALLKSRLKFRFAAAGALVAALSMAAMPAAAASMPGIGPATGKVTGAVPAVAEWNIGQETARDYRGRDGYPRYGRHHRHRGGIDAGDVLAGVLILGGIAAIASAASNSKAKRERDYRDPDYPAPDYRGPDYRERDSGYYRDDDKGYAQDGSGLGRAAETCVREVERNEAVGSVEGVQRDADGWRVDGVLRNGRPFSCAIDAGGRVRGLEYGSPVASGAGAQWDDESYSRARERADSADARGPIDGDLAYAGE